MGIKDYLAIGFISLIVMFAPITIILSITGVNTSYCDGVGNCIDAWLSCISQCFVFGLLGWWAFKKVTKTNKEVGR